MPETPAPLVSVVMPAYNAEPFLEQAIHSVLAQDYRPVEVIVVSDGSTDRTLEIARSFGEPVRVAGQEHSGIAVTRNRGAAEAQGALLAFLDADDLWTPQKLSAQWRLMAADPSLDAIFGLAAEFRETPEGQIQEQPPIPAKMPSTALIRMDAFRRVGWFRTDVVVGEFIDWWARAEELGLRSAFVPEVVLRRRIHGSNTGVRERAAQGDYARVLRDALIRRRAGGGI